ncbi:hypothetical protein BDF20DRAFT_867118 [Mycotypha africana]|uniref:uncharacterized protein n=1 Tax=Mycotypha africana TaxID=64632 RepID=UPI0023019000|nr:uncharacterized protein BDF20DRAFT_867118 [Mycotypha africana]KAI8982465.1 hypothetical protein BDF20DRAFT_867118 [Mycotypha africana]
MEITEHVDDVNAVATSSTGTFASGGNEGCVYLYTEENQFGGVLVRSSFPVRSLSFHPDGSKIAIATDETTIRIVLCADNSKIVTAEGHSSPVKSLTYDSTGDYLASSDIMGTVRLWNVSPSEPAPRCIKVLPSCSYRSDMESLLQTTVAFSPDDSSFAFPGDNNDICVYSKYDWEPSYTLADQHTQPVITFAWSPNGVYLASSSSDDSVVVWNTKTRKPVHNEVVIASVTSIVWSPTKNELTLTDARGQFRIWKDVIPLDQPDHPHPAAPLKKPVILENKKIKTEKNNATKKTGSSSSSSDIGKRSINRLLIDEEASDSDEGGEDTDMLLEEAGEDVDVDDDDDEEREEGLEENFVVDDDGAGYAEAEVNELSANGGRVQQRLNLGNMHTSHLLHQRQTKLEEAFELPAVFQPGETPYHKAESGKSFEPAQGERRYMAYNLVGAISTIFEVDHSIINVEFHDQSQYNNFHFTDMNQFTLGALSSAGTVFAVEAKKQIVTEKKKDELDELFDEEADDGQEKVQEINSIIYFRPHRLGSEKDWTHHMLPDENVTCIAINNSSVIAATSLGHVRIFSISGVQRFIFTLQNVVTMAAMADLALVVYTPGPSYNQQQNLQYILLNTDTNEVLQKDTVQMTTDNEIVWVGFSETVQAVTYDTAGVLRILHNQRRPFQGRWIPVFDRKLYMRSHQKQSETYWPVGVLRDRFMCVILRGQTTYPFFPRPPVKELPLQLPLLDMANETGQLEEQILKTEVRARHERDEAEATQTEGDYLEIFRDAEIEIDIAVLKLINIACKAERISKAENLTYILHTPEAIDKAIKIALYHRYTSLAEKMTNIKEAKFIDGQTIHHKTLQDSISELPTVYGSTKPTLEGDLAFVKREREQNSNKRDMVDADGDEEMMEARQTAKRPKPFRFSNLED